MLELIMAKANERKKLAFLIYTGQMGMTYKKVGHIFDVSATRANQLIIHGAKLFCNPKYKKDQPIPWRNACALIHNGRYLCCIENFYGEHQDWFTEQIEAEEERWRKERLWLEQKENARRTDHERDDA